MKIKLTAILIFFSWANLSAWYPDYSVLATDFVLPNNFLAPARIHSIGLQALGPQFVKIYSDPIDDVFQNPAYLNFLDRNVAYLEMAGNSAPKTRKRNWGIYPAYEYASGGDMMNPWWSPYRYTREPKQKDPIASALYLGHPLGKFLGLGASLEFFFNRETFYQPEWYWNAWMDANAVGTDYETGSQDPYQDYRDVKRGENLQNESGVKLNLFTALPLTNRLSLGTHAVLQSHNSDGNYRDMTNNDYSQWADDYDYSWDTRKQQKQNFDQKEISLGLLWTTEKQVRLGIHGGIAQGTISRNYFESDSSRYFSRYHWYSDTSKVNRYLSTGAYESDKNWEYGGNMVFGEIHGDIPVSPDATLRFSGYHERRRADLDEAEVMWRRSNYESEYWYENNSVLEKYSYTDQSHAELNRTGNGIYKNQYSRFSLGGDWRFSPGLRLVGGIAYNQRLDKKSATEPFTGDKYSHTIYSRGSGGVTTTEAWQEDDREFRWNREELYTTVAVPLGAIMTLSEFFEFRVGLTKLLRNTDITERYDVIVNRDYNTTINNGVTTITADSVHVEGYKFPGTHRFTDQYDLNAGITFRYKDHLRLSAVMQKSVWLEDALKFGVEIFW